MDNLPEDERPYQPTEQDWAEYREWLEEQHSRPADNFCEAHGLYYPHADAECPRCQEDWEQTWALGDEPSTDWWYMDLLMQASHGAWDPHQGWRAEQ